MSSILDALRQLESTGRPAAPVADESGERPSRRPIVMGGLALAFVTGVGIALVFRHDPQPPPSSSVRTAAPSRAPAVLPAADSLPVAPAVPAPVVASDADAPWARVSTPEPQAVSSTPVRERPTLAVARTTDFERADAPLMRPQSAPRASGEPHVRLAALDYSTSMGRRSASLIVNGGTPVTLHEGESTRDVEVTLILPDRVYLRRAGQVFAVHAGE